MQDTILKQPDIYYNEVPERFSNISATFGQASRSYSFDISQNEKATKSKDLAPFLRAKIKTMHRDYEKLQQEFRKKVPFCNMYISMNKIFKYDFSVTK